MPGADEDADLVISAIDADMVDADDGAGAGRNPFDASKPAISVTGHSLGAKRSCAHGCLLSPDARFLAVANGPPTMKGFTWELAILDNKLRAHFKGGVITDAQDLHFAKDSVLWSTPRNLLENGKSQFRIMRRDLSGLSAKDAELAVIAADHDPDVKSPIGGNGPHTTYNGRFSVSDDAATLLFTTPTIRSVRIWSLRAGQLIEHDYICAHPHGDGCVGTGSVMRDDAPVTLSPDGRTAVAFVQQKERLEVRRYDVATGKAPQFSVLAHVAAGFQPSNKHCAAIKHVRFNSQVGRPAFSHDGKHVVFIGRSDCKGGAPVDKPITQVWAVSVAAIGGKLLDDDLQSWTSFSTDGGSQQVQLSELALSPDRRHIVLEGTPRTGLDGLPLAATSPRHRKDTELYVMQARKGGKVVQVTGEPKSWVRGPIAAKKRASK